MEHLIEFYFDDSGNVHQGYHVFGGLILLDNKKMIEQKIRQYKKIEKDIRERNNLSNEIKANTLSK